MTKVDKVSSSLDWAVLVFKHTPAVFIARVLIMAVTHYADIGAKWKSTINPVTPQAFSMASMLTDESDHRSHARWKSADVTLNKVWSVFWHTVHFTG